MFLFLLADFPGDRQRVDVDRDGVVQQPKVCQALDDARIRRARPAGQADQRMIMPVEEETELALTVALAVPAVFLNRQFRSETFSRVKIEPLGQNADFKMGRDIVFAMARGRMTIGLYNSYDRSRFAEAHRRAIARAAPIALAFDGNLATFGFPFEEGLITPQEVAGWVSSTTSIGEAGLYLRELAQRGRFQTFGFPKRGFPPQLGEPIVTTNRPDPKKATTATALAGLLQRGTSILLVFGLGRRGLDDRDVYPLGRYHFDLTGRGLSLETATAIGAAPALIAAHLVA